MGRHMHPRLRRPAFERFLAKVDTDGPPWNGIPCWMWMGCRTAEGYGRFKDETTQLGCAHRWAFEHFVGPIPDGLTLDHLCLLPFCVRPEHLEPVTSGENSRRRFRRPG